MFADIFNVPVVGRDKNMINASANNIPLSILEWEANSPGWVTFSRTESGSVSRKMWRIKDRNQVGDYILPIATIRGEGTSGVTFLLKFRPAR